MLSLYNTLTRKKQVFKPLKKGIVGMYCCGPTVYDFAHIGNLRTYIFEDVLRRALVVNGFKLKTVMNFTDIDDKIIRRSHELNESIAKLTARFTKAFRDDEKKLNIIPVQKYAPATRHIKDMIALVLVLLKKGVAYEKDGSVYFSLRKFKNYGTLSQLDAGALKIGASVEADEYAKDDARDFVLWKASKPGEPVWKVPFGSGRPGWHLECSAMAMKYLGATIDIHAGAVDLVFPHHENEIAQSEAATGKKFVNYWVHGEHLLVDNAKMAKSANNFYTLRDVEEKEIAPLAFRYLCLGAHYRSKLNFTWESLEGASNGLKNLYEIVAQWAKSAQPSKKYMQAFETCLNNDLDMPGALAVMWKLIKDETISSAIKSATVLNFDNVFGLDLKKYVAKPVRVPIAVKKLADERELARTNKDWKKADKLRAQIQKMGYCVEDGPQGPVVKLLVK